MTVSSKTAIDGVSLEILWNRLIGVAEEAAFVVQRTSFSTVVREANDYACGLVSVNGLGICENTWAIPGFASMMARTTREFLKRYPASEWSEGDVVITNDPWIGTGHLNDFTIAMPIFRRGKLVAFCTSIAHMSDIGGLIWSADGREVFEEGIRVPISRLYRRGKLNRTLADIIFGNVRLPREVQGDLEAMRASCEVAARRVVEIMNEERLDTLEDLVEAIQRRAETVMRRAIEAVPDGAYRGEVEIDGVEEPLRICAEVRVKGDAVQVDYAGTSPQVDRGINCPWVGSYVHTAYAIKCILDPFTPRNDGSFRPISMVAPEGTLVNPKFPAPVAGRQIVLQCLNAPIFSALAPVLPERVLAHSGSPNIQLTYNGYTADDRPFTVIQFLMGGMGARSAKDGLAATSYPTNAGGPSLEIIESIAPLVFREKALAEDSGGPGTFRGGLGQRMRVELRSPRPTVVAIIADRVQHPASGLLGGQAAQACVLRRSDGTPLPSKSRVFLRAGTVLEFQTAGGGGYGPPQLREREKVLDDVLNGYVSRETASGFHNIATDGAARDGRS
jgi:N-methylhydantoinase B